MKTPKTLFARALRTADNPSERALWSVLKSSTLGGYKFTRQLPIGPYFADFACRSEMLVIELDGSQHHDAVDYDASRDDYMLRCGYSVLRLPSAATLNGIDGICDTILAVLEGRVDDVVEAPDMCFRRSFERPARRGLASRNALRSRTG